MKEGLKGNLRFTLGKMKEGFKGNLRFPFGLKGNP
jgi:hypothetical protein